MFATPVFADSGEAAGKVREGIAQFQGGDFKSAAESFSAADEALPNELKIAFDRGCAYVGGGEFDKAVEQFQKAAAASDHKLAALANYNLGGVAVARAKEKLGQKPEEAEGEARTAALEFLLQAAKHYRDCLSMDADNADARYNLETLRLWIKHIQDVWQNRDRQKRRDAMNLLQYLEWLEGEQRALMQTGKELQKAKPSPRQREAIRAVENAQRSLAEEIQPLKEKISSALTAPPQQTGANQAASPGPDVQKAVELLHGLADEVGQSMGKAAESLAGKSLTDAAGPQTQAVEKIDQIFMAVAPFSNLVQRGINRQEELINQSPAAENQEKTDESKDMVKQTQPSDSKESHDGADAAWNQRFVARYGRILEAKARRELERIETQPAPSAPNAAQTPEKEQQSEEQLKAREQQKDLKEALQLGVQSAPKVEKLAEEAAQLLEEDKAAEALPKQQEALKLLKDMLPKKQKQDQEKQDQEKKDQEKKDKDKKDQEKQDQNKKDQDKKNQEKQGQQKEQEKKDQGQKGQNKQDQQKKEEEKNRQQQKQQEQNKRDLNKQQAEGVLQKARLRQDQHRELEKQLEGYLYRPEKVEKDW